MLALILSIVKTSDEVLGEMKAGFFQLSHTILSHAILIKILEAHLLALSSQVHNSTRGNVQSSIDITTKTSTSYAINTYIEIPLHGAHEE